jgi:uncharacterized protein (TIGR02265 family)
LSSHRKNESASGPPSATGSSQWPWLAEPSLRLRERLAGVPSDGLVKGWLIHSIVENAKRAGVELATEKKYLTFRDYPIREYLELLGQAAMRVEPEKPPIETLRELGRGVYATFSRSLFGKVIIAGLGEGHTGARTGLRWVSRIYKMTSNHAAVDFTESSERTSVVTLKNVWSFPDAYHVGIFEGAARAFGGNVSVQIASASLSSATLTFTWES